MKEASMKNNTMRRFTSALDFLARLADVFRGPTFLMTYLRVDPKFREKIMLAVSVANNCYG
jgi:hypothetical protein